MDIQQLQERLREVEDVLKQVHEAYATLEEYTYELVGGESETLTYTNTVVQTAMNRLDYTS